MKAFAVALAIGSWQTLCAAEAVTTVDLGPQGCVHVSQTSSGTCAIQTDCLGKAEALAQFEFAFNCENGAEVVRHSFGVGQFDEQEFWDSEIDCSRCGAPGLTQVGQQQEKQMLKAVTSLEEQQQQQQQQLQQQQPRQQQKLRQRMEKASTFVADSVRAQASASVADSDALQQQVRAGEVPFGPNGCLSTYKSPAGTCVLKTVCSTSDLASYAVGFICVDKIGVPVRHNFGLDAFRSSETFDSLVPCDKCFGLDDVPNVVALNGRVMSLASQMSNIGSVLKEVSSQVQALDGMLDGANVAAAPSPAAAVAQSPIAAGYAPAPAPAAALMATKATVNLKGSAEKEDSHEVVQESLGLASLRVLGHLRGWGSSAPLAQPVPQVEKRPAPGSLLQEQQAAAPGKAAVVPSDIAAPSRVAVAPSVTTPKSELADDLASIQSALELSAAMAKKREKVASVNAATTSATQSVAASPKMHKARPPLVFAQEDEKHTALREEDGNDDGDEVDPSSKTEAEEEVLEEDDVDDEAEANPADMLD